MRLDDVGKRNNEIYIMMNSEPSGAYLEENGIPIYTADDVINSTSVEKRKQTSLDSFTSQYSQSERKSTEEENIEYFMKRTFGEPLEPNEPKKEPEPKNIEPTPSTKQELKTEPKPPTIPKRETASNPQTQKSLPKAQTPQIEPIKEGVTSATQGVKTGLQQKQTAEIPKKESGTKAPTTESTKSTAQKTEKKGLTEEEEKRLRKEKRREISRRKFGGYGFTYTGAYNMIYGNVSRLSRFISLGMFVVGIVLMILTLTHVIDLDESTEGYSTAEYALMFSGLIAFLFTLILGITIGKLNTDASISEMMIELVVRLTGGTVSVILGLVLIKDGLLTQNLGLGDWQVAFGSFFLIIGIAIFATTEEIFLLITISILLIGIWFWDDKLYVGDYKFFFTVILILFGITGAIDSPKAIMYLTSISVIAAILIGIIKFQSDVTRYVFLVSIGLALGIGLVLAITLRNRKKILTEDDCINSGGIMVDDVCILDIDEKSCGDLDGSWNGSVCYIDILRGDDKI